MKLLNAGLVLIFFFFIITPLKADEWGVDATVNQSLTYDDNIRLTEEDVIASGIYKITPTLNFFHRTQNSSVNANASYGAERFSDAEQFDSETQRYGISGAYRTIKSTWRVNSLYSVAPQRDSAEDDTGNFGTISDETTRRIAPSVSYQLTEIDNLSLSSSWSDTNYESDNFSDRENIDINATWSRQWTHRYTGGISLFYSNFESLSESFLSDSLSITETVGINVSNTYLISKKWTFAGQIGIRITESDTETKFNPRLGIRNTNVTDSSEGFLIDSSFRYVDENLSGDVSLNRSLIPSSRGQLNEQTRFSAKALYKFSPRLSTDIFASYLLSESSSDTNSFERTSFTLSPRVNWKIAPEWTVSASYRFRKQLITTDSFESEANSNAFILSLKYDWQGLSLAR